MERIDVNGIYKHSPMNEAQINAEKNDDREIVINETQVTEAAPASSSDTDRTKFNPSYRCDTIYGKIRRNIATLETLALDGSQSTNDNLCGADLIGIDSTETYGVIQDATTVQGAIKELDTAVSEGGDLSNPVEELLVMNAGFKMNPFSEDSGTWTDVRYNETYTWKKFNGKIWMTQNFRSGGSTNWLNNATQQANQNPTLGKVYTFSEASSLCPSGWRLPTKEDFDELIANETAQSLASTQTGSTAGEVGWYYTWGQTNDSGFNAYPTGYWRYYGQGSTSPSQWRDRQYFAYYWSSTVAGSDETHGNGYNVLYLGCGSNNGTPSLNTSTVVYDHANTSNMWDSVPVRVGVRYIFDVNPEITIVKNAVETVGSDHAIVTEKAVRTELDKKANNVFTAKGCIAIGNDAGTQAARLGIGTEGQFLMVSSAGRPQWASLYLGVFTSSTRPANPINGSFGFDVTVNNVIWYINGAWVNAGGSMV